MLQVGTFAAAVFAACRLTQKVARSIPAPADDERRERHRRFAPAVYVAAPDPKPGGLDAFPRVSGVACRVGWAWPSEGRASAVMGSHEALWVRRDRRYVWRVRDKAHTDFQPARPATAGAPSPVACRSGPSLATNAADAAWSRRSSASVCWQS